MSFSSLTLEELAWLGRGLAWLLEDSPHASRPHNITSHTRGRRSHLSTTVRQFRFGPAWRDGHHPTAASKKLFYTHTVVLFESFGYIYKYENKIKLGNKNIIWTYIWGLMDRHVSVIGLTDWLTQINKRTIAEPFVYRRSYVQHVVPSRSLAAT
jgi:hypothetical protein